MLRVVLFASQSLTAYFLVIVLAGRGQGWQLLLGLIALVTGAYLIDRLVLERWTARGESPDARHRQVATTR